jgi:hypothetical protein
MTSHHFLPNEDGKAIIFIKYFHVIGGQVHSVENNECTSLQ